MFGKVSHGHALGKEMLDLHEGQGDAKCMQVEIYHLFKKQGGGPHIELTHKKFIIF